MRRLNNRFWLAMPGAVPIAAILLTAFDAGGAEPVSRKIGLEMSANSTICA
jgi:hypothetical protein